MKICLAGRFNIAIEVCEYLLTFFDVNDILIIPTESDKGDNTFQRSFLQFAKQANLKIVSLHDVYDISDLIFLSMEYDKILKPNRFASKELFNIHFSLLPKYKGMYPSALPILFGETETGVTLHRIDSGIDTGDIIAQKEISISRDETAKSLHNKLINIYILYV
jgi:methionyl-tRNA formyltransferase